MSQQAGGIGTRGRRRDPARGRPSTHPAPHPQARGDLRDIDPAPGDAAQGQRRGAGHAAWSIVGYTNAGKSTLLNRLTDAGVLVEDRLFATLDATTRRLQLPGGEAVLLTDTVGFVRKLPHQLVEAFTLHARGGRRRRPAGARRRRVGRRSAVPDRRRPRRARRDRRRRVPELLCFNKTDQRRGEAPGRPPTRVGRHLGPHR